jgi:deoxyribodipyrimidine photo-lyase
MRRNIVWFRNDLRLGDNEALNSAIDNSDEIIPIYIIDDRQFQKDIHGFPKTGLHRKKFLLQSLKDLSKALKRKGANLMILKGHPELVLPEIAEKYKVDSVYAHKEVTHEEIVIEHTLANLLDLYLFWGSTLYHIDDIPMKIHKIPDVFTNFRKSVEKNSKVRNLIPEPEIIRSCNTEELIDTTLLDFNPDASMDVRSAFPFEGGATAANERLAYYLFQTKLLSSYKFTRNGLVGTDYSSKFSPWLANGSLSPRQVFWAVRKYEQEVKKNISTYWLIFELIWRDFFRFTAMKYGNRLFHSAGIKNKKKSWQMDLQIFEQWRRGETGIPFVDANMKELLLTGWMSNRGRQNVASYLVHDLDIDWRIGAAWFESQLLDYDPCSNYGNWQYVAGIGNDPRENRKFDIEWQASKYDPKGEYIDLWLKNGD